MVWSHINVGFVVAVGLAGKLFTFKNGSINPQFRPNMLKHVREKHPEARGMYMGDKDDRVGDKDDRMEEVIDVKTDPRSAIEYTPEPMGQVRVSLFLIIHSFKPVFRIKSKLHKVQLVCRPLWLVRVKHPRLQLLPRTVWWATFSRRPIKHPFTCPIWAVHSLGSNFFNSKPLQVAVFRHFSNSHFWTFGRTLVNNRVQWQFQWTTSGVKIARRFVIRYI